MLRSARNTSLVRQTVWIVLAAQLLGAGLLCAAALLHERSARMRAFDVMLAGRSDSLLGAIQDAEDADDNVSVDPAELRLPEQDLYAVYNQGGRLLGRSGQPGAPALTPRLRDGFHEARLGDAHFRVLQREAMRVIDRADNAGQGLRRPVTIVYAAPEGNIWRETLEAARFYLIAIALAAVLTVMLVSVLVRRALLPLRELAAAAEQLTAPALHFRAPASVLRVRELQPLAEVLAATVQRLRLAFRKEQQFVGDAAHELKTAIAVVRSSVQLLMLRRRTVEEYTAGLDRVLEDSSRVEALVAQMLQLASLEESTAAPTALVNLAELAATALARLGPYAEQRGVLLQLLADAPAMVPMRSDRALVLITNLVLNAVQHSPPGRPVIVTTTMITTVGAPGQLAATLMVADQGAGIAAGALPHIFDRFYREDRSRARETGGAGLGLAICKAAVQGSGGSIAVVSQPGSGTRVTVTFSMP